MQSKLQAAINQICAEKNLDHTIVIEAIENGIALAYKKDFGNAEQTIKVVLGDDISDMKIFEERTVAQKVEDHANEIALKDAQLINPVTKIGDTIYIPMQLEENFGRIAAQTAKHVMGQKLQEAERAMLFEKMQEVKAKEYEDIMTEIPNFVVTNMTYDLPEIQKDSSNIEKNKDWIKNVKKDPYIFESLKILEDIKQ